MLRLLDEVMDLGDLGAALLWMEAEGETVPYAGMKLRDANGNIHEVAAGSREEQICTLVIPDGRAAYFERLFRNVFVDACAFEEVV